MLLHNFSHPIVSFLIFIASLAFAFPNPLPEVRNDKLQQHENDGHILEQRASRPVPSLASLGCIVSPDADGYEKVQHFSNGRADFLMQARIDDSTETLYRKNAQQANPDGFRPVKAREVSLAYFKHASRYDVKYLRHIVYEQIVNDDTLEAVEYVQETYGPDCSDGWCRVSWNSEEAFNYLIQNSPHAKGSAYIPHEFTEFSRHYVSSFDWADPEEVDEVWFRVNFKTYDDEN